MNRVALPAAISVLLLVGCGGQKHTKAAYCATVGAMHTQDRRNDNRVVELMQPFVQRHHLLLPDGEHPDTDEYTDASGTVLMDVTFAMGDAGSVITMFYENGKGDGLRADLDKFLLSDVDPVFRVRHCRDVPGFGTPELIGMAKPRYPSPASPAGRSA